MGPSTTSQREGVASVRDECEGCKSGGRYDVWISLGMRSAVVRRAEGVRESLSARERGSDGARGENYRKRARGSESKGGSAGRVRDAQMG